jgi:hypothetical protein
VGRGIGKQQGMGDELEHGSEISFQRSPLERVSSPSSGCVMGKAECECTGQCDSTILRTSEGLLRSEFCKYVLQRTT